MSSPESTPSGCCAGLPGMASGQRRCLVIGAAVGLAAALIGTTILGPTYEATAFLEAADDSDLTTVEEKLRFPSLYREITENDEAARDLARRSRAKIRRGSRLIAVTVAHSEPEIAATEANRLVETFLATGSTAESTPAPARPSLPDPAAADSPESLAEAWKVQSDEFGKLSQRYANDSAHPAVVGARQRLDALGKRIAERVADLRSQFGLPEEPAGDPGAALASLQAALSGSDPPPATKPRTDTGHFPLGPLLRIAEAAVAPAEPTGPGNTAIWLGGAAMGAFAALLFLWCCPCCLPRN